MELDSLFGARARKGSASRSTFLDDDHLAWKERSHTTKEIGETRYLAAGEELG
jgi:hypothetical protein